MALSIIHETWHLRASCRGPESALFVSKQGTRLTPHAISHGIKSLARRSGHAHVTLHQFRHSCASDLLEKKFQEALKKAKETPDTGKPIRDFDLD